MVFLFGCGGAITPLRAMSAERAQLTANACSQLFPRGGFEATSVVEASIPFSDDASLIAVVTSPQDQSEFRSVIMSQEGVVLFDAIRRGADIQVQRALPPLDPQGFGRQMTDDIRLVSFRPRGEPVVGWTEQGAAICRWVDGERTVDVTLTGQATAKLVEIRAGRVVRDASLEDLRVDGGAREIVLDHPGITGYRLRLILQSLESK